MKKVVMDRDDDDYTRKRHVDVDDIREQLRRAPATDAKKERRGDFPLLHGGRERQLSPYPPDRPAGKYRYNEYPVDTRDDSKSREIRHFKYKGQQRGGGQGGYARVVTKDHLTKRDKGKQNEPVAVLRHDKPGRDADGNPIYRGGHHRAREIVPVEIAGREVPYLGRELAYRHGDDGRPTDKGIVPTEGRHRRTVEDVTDSFNNLMGRRRRRRRGRDGYPTDSGEESSGSEDSDMYN